MSGHLVLCSPGLLLSNRAPECGAVEAIGCCFGQQTADANTRATVTAAAAAAAIARTSTAPSYLRSPTRTLPHARAVAHRFYFAGVRRQHGGALLPREADHGHQGRRARVRLRLGVEVPGRQLRGHGALRRPVPRGKQAQPPPHGGGRLVPPCQGGFYLSKTFVWVIVWVIDLFGLNEVHGVRKDTEGGWRARDGKGKL